MQFAQIGDINTHFQVIGAPEGKPLLVFVNGLGTDFRIWRDVIVRFVGEAAILTYDKRGHGLTDLGDARGSMDQLIEDLASLLDHLRQSRAVIVGLSIGGLIAQGLAHQRPDLVNGLVLSDTATRIGTTEVWDERISAVESAGIEALADATMERWFTAGFKADNLAELQGYRTLLTRQPVSGYLNGCMAIRDADFSESSAGLAVPTLCLGGDEDGSTPPEVVQDLAKTIPHARYELVKGAGHLPCIEQPDLVADMIKAFFDAYGLWGRG